MDQVELVSGLPFLGAKLASQAQQEHQPGGNGRTWHPWKIGTAALIVCLITGCAARQFEVETGPSRAQLLAALPPQSADQLLFPDRSGVSPPDTVVRFAARTGRTVVLRHAPPDNAVFAMLTVPGDTTAADSLTLTLRVTPGRYGLLITGEPRLPTGTVLTFSYAIHFQAPPEIPSPAYPTTTRYADWLAIGQLLGNGGLRYLQTARPGGDLLRTVLTEGGEYLIAAPVTPP